MALRKLMSFSGKSYVQTEVGVIEIADAIVQMNAYIKVETVSGTKSTLSVNVSFVDANKKFIKTYVFDVNLDGANYIAQAYEYLKTLPEFEDSIDC
jgi:uncharacterized protein (UPF0254 family)